MISRRAKKLVAASTLGAALLVPAVATSASAHPGNGPRPHGHSRVALTDAQKAAIKAANATHRAAIKAAKATYKADTADERATLTAALAAATTRAERRAAFKAYYTTTADERAALKAAVKAANAAHRAAIKAILATT